MFSSVILFISSIILGFGGFIGYAKMVAEPISPTPQATVTSTPTPFEYNAAQAPARSLPATITQHEGKLMWESRMATEPAELKEIVTLQQGESIGTEEDSSLAFKVGIHLTVSLETESQVSLTQTLPESIVMTQKKGVVTYDLSTREQPFALRVGRMLIRLSHGSMTISQVEDDPIITVKIHKGTAQIAYNDASFDTQQLLLTSDEVFVFDNDAREGEVQ